MMKHLIFIFSFLFAVALNLLCLSKGIYILAHNLYYFPIIVGVFFYHKKGLLLSGLVLAVYFATALTYKGGSIYFTIVFIRAALMIGLALLIYFLYDFYIKNMEENRIRQKRFQIILSAIRDGIIVTDGKGNIEFINDKARTICDLTDKKTRKRPLGDLMKVYSKDGTLIPLCMLNNQTETCLEPRTESGYVIHENKSRRDVELYIAPIMNRQGVQKGNTIVIHDSTVQKEAEEKIQYLTYHDKLTGISNRRHFEEQLIKLDVPDNYPISIIVADVNGLKLTNDAFGHIVGDKLLIAAANSLQKVCRPEDLVARWGGDEFILLLPNTDEQYSSEIIQKVLDNNKHEMIDNIFLSVTMGYAVKYHKEEDLERVINQADDMMYKEKLSVSRSVKNKTVNIILQTLYVKNEEERAHAMGISRLVNRLEGTLNLTKAEITDLRVLGQIHDIGKITIDESVLNKKESLTEEEYEMIKRHSEKGYQIIKASPELMYLADEVLCHHERYDGTGYPRGLKKNDIPKLARILTVADAVIAMLSDRPYRKALSLEQTISELKENSGTQFDPEIVEAFMQFLPTYKMDF